MEVRAKAVLAKAKTRTEALRMLQRDGFRADEAERVVLRHFKQQPQAKPQQQAQLKSPQQQAQQHQPQQRRKTPDNRNVEQIAVPMTGSQQQLQSALTPRDQHVDLIAFSHNVSMR